MSKIKKHFIFIERLKFQKRSALKFIRRIVKPKLHKRSDLKVTDRTILQIKAVWTIPQSGGCNIPQFAGNFFPKLALGFIPVIIAVLFIYPLPCLAQNVTSPEKSKSAVKQDVPKPANKDTKKIKSGLTITPQEINLGTVAFDKVSEGIFTLKSTSSRIIDWSTDGPEGWKKSEQQKLSGSLDNASASLRLEIRFVTQESSSDQSKQQNPSGHVEMKLESGGGKISFTKVLSTGTHKEEIKINSTVGQKTLLVTFAIAYTQKSPLIDLNPLRLDMGTVLPEKSIFKKIILKNSGKDILTWSAAMRKHQKEDVPDDFQQGRYISFANDVTKDTGSYAIPMHLKETIELTGNWTEINGYPSAIDSENFIKINFSGTGVILYLLNYQQKGKLSIALDKHLIDENDISEALEDSEGELLIDDELTDGPHVLTITSKRNNVTFEGVKILGGKMNYFPAGCIKIFPDSGAITRQTNYLTVSLNPAQMLPGYYVDDIVFSTNSGEAIVEVFAEVLADTISKAIDIFRYYNGNDYLFTSDPQSETKRLVQNNYVKEGIAFRLFKPDTPGTTSFYRWYSPERRSHFYHYDSAGGKKDLKGYIFEGSIGNIATSRLTNTRELYRWYNAKTGHYFYSTDIQGEKVNKREFRFDGIAGYVK